MVGRLVKFTVIASCTAFLAFFVSDHAMSAFAEEGSATVVIRDVVGTGVHALSGIVMLPSLCDQLRVSSEKLETTRYHLVFSTWREPYRDCVAEETPRHFKSQVFAPSAGISFTAELDEKPLAIIVVPTTK